MNLQEQMEIFESNLKINKCNCECDCNVEILGEGQCSDCHYSHR